MSVDLKKIKYIFMNLNYRNLLISNALNRCGDAMDTLLLSWLVYTSTNSPTLTAVVFGINKFTSIVCQPLVGPIVEKHNKKYMMIYPDLLRGISMVFLMISTFLSINIYVLAIYALLVSFFEAFRQPAGNAIYSLVVPKEEYDLIISFNTTLSTISSLIGMAVIGILLSFCSLAIILLIVSMCFFSTFLFMKKIRVEKEKSSVHENKYIDMLKDCLIYVKKSPMVLRLCFICMLINGLVIPFDSLQAVFVKSVMRCDAWMLSLISVCVSLGTIVGSLIYASLRERYSILKLFCISGGGLGVYYILITGITYAQISIEFLIIYVGVFSFLLGIGIAILNVYVRVSLISIIDKNYISRVSAFATSLTMLIDPVMSFFIGFIVIYVSVQLLYFICGCAIILIFMVFFFLGKKI